MSGEGWDEDARDLVYTEICRAITDAGAGGETLYLARLALLLIEQLKSRDAALQAIAEAKDRREG
jgi:hypothetical protein